MTVTKINGNTEYQYYVPSTCSKTGREVFVETLQRRALTQNGGVTMIDGQGAYLSKSGDIINEPVLIIKTIGQPLMSEQELEDAALALNQECLMVVKVGNVEGSLYFP